MKKSLKLYLALLLIGGFVLTFSSCKDSENVNDIPTTPEEIAQSKETDEARALLSVLSFTSELDSLPDNWFSNSYTVEPTIGIVNDESTPYVRYVTVQDKNEAIIKYNSFADKSIAEGSTSANWDINGVGSVNFNLLDQKDVIATLDVSIKQLPHLSQIRFVPAGTLGTNATVKGEPYYSFGDVVSLKEGNNKSYWVCVRPCSQLMEKGTSHWMSFQLNDWDSKENKGVTKGSVNIAKLTKKGYQDYYMPTKLGNESESREHLQNLFNLLRILDNPNKFTEEAFPDGFAGIPRAEFNEYDAKTISEDWTANLNWGNVLPKNVSVADLENCFNQDGKVNVFYYGYHSTPSVYRAELTLQDGVFKLPEDKANDLLSWKRGKESVDFREYANNGVKGQGWGVSALPTKGFVVRYKTGAQLIGSWGNDDHPTKSFHDDNKDVEDKYVYKSIKRERNWGRAVIGDYIETDDMFFGIDVCVLNNSNDAPNTWNGCSYFFRYDTGHKVLQNKEISTSAYLHLLNALIIHSNEYELYCKNVNESARKLPKWSNYYTDGVGYMLSYLTDDIEKILDEDGEEAIIRMVDFKAEDATGHTNFTKDNIKDLAKFSLKIAFKDKNTKDDYYNTAILTYTLSTGKYTLTDIKRNLKDETSTDALDLKAYKDESRVIVGDDQTFKENDDNYEDRDEVKKATMEFLNNNKVE